VSAAIILDTGPVGWLSSPSGKPPSVACRAWANALRVAGRRVIVPEIADYEVRRELLRAGKAVGIAILDGLCSTFEYLPLSTAAMRKAAELWALARRQGRPTAPDPALDGDVILAAQALTRGAPQIVVTTSNVGHLSRFVPAEPWRPMLP
jgi:predicted nucleic acid-binding protein